MSTFITIILVAICATARILLREQESLGIAIAIINILMMYYVFYIVSYKLYDCLKKRIDKNSIYKDQYEHFREDLKIFWLIMVIIGGGYVYATLRGDDMVISCINDCIAFVTFGLSLEEEKIFKNIQEHYYTTDFALKKSIKRNGG